MSSSLHLSLLSPTPLSELNWSELSGSQVFSLAIIVSTTMLMLYFSVSYLTSPVIPNLCVPLLLPMEEDSLAEKEKTRKELAEESKDGFPSKPHIDPEVLFCFNPCTSELLGEVKKMNSNDVREVVKKAKVAQESWSKTTFAERRRVLNTMQKYIVNHIDEIAKVASLDSGKPMIEAILGEIMTTCEKIRTINNQGEGWLKAEYRKPGPMMMHKTAYVEYRPLGVLGVIAPWNYPFHNLMNHIISGIFSGNAVVSKVSEYTSWSGQYFYRIAQEALSACGHNPDLVQVVTGLGDTGAALVACDDVDKIIFTGSPEVGKLVMAGAAPHLKPVILELGGKDPFVILDDANLDEIIPMALKGAFFNCGQNCCGAERFFVYEKNYESFVSKLEAKVSVLTQGPAVIEQGKLIKYDCGAMVMPRQLEIIQELVDDAVAKGARLICGGKKNQTFPAGNFYTPTLLVDVNQSMRIANEEVFGPVMTVFKVPQNDDNVCIQMVNNCNYGLGSSVFSGDQKRAIAIGNQIRAGMTTINDFGVNYLVQALPFGGVKHSGFDRFAGPEGLRACCLMKSVVVDTVPFIKTSIPAQLQYPVSQKTFPFGKALMSLFYNPSPLEKIKAIFTLAA